MISATQAPVPRRLHPFAHLVGFHIRAGLPVAAGVACVLLAVQLFVRLYPRMRFLSAGDRGLLMSILLLVASALIALLVGERENPHLLLTLPISPRRAMFAEIVATWSLSLLLTGMGLFGLDLYAFVFAGTTDLWFGPLWLLPLLGLVLGQGIVVAISKSTSLFARNFLLRLGTLVGWVLLGLGAAWAAAWPFEETIFPLFFTSLLLLLAVSLWKSDLLLVRRLTLLKAHLVACGLLFLLPLGYIINLYGTRFTGPVNVDNRSVLFPRLEFAYILNPRTGEPERYGWLAPLAEKAWGVSIRDGWLFTSAANASPFSVRSVRRLGDERVFLTPEGAGALTVNGRPFWIRVLPQLDIKGSKVSLRSVTNSDLSIDLEVPNRAEIKPLWPIYFDFWPSFEDRALLLLESEKGPELFSIRGAGHRLTATPLGEGYGIHACERFFAFDLPSGQGRKIFDSKSRGIIDLDLGAEVVSIFCDPKTLAIMQSSRELGSRSRQLKIDLIPLDPDPNIASRRQVEIKNCQDYTKALFWTLNRGLYSTLAPEQLIVRIPESLGEIGSLQRIDKSHVLMDFRSGRYALIDLASPRVWPLEPTPVEGESLRLFLDSSSHHLDLKQGTLTLLDSTGVWKASLATGAWQTKPLKDLPITWLN